MVTSPAMSTPRRSDGTYLSNSRTFNTSTMPPKKRPLSRDSSPSRKRSLATGASNGPGRAPDRYIDHDRPEPRRDPALLPRNGAIDNRSPLNTNVSPRTRHGESGQLGSGVSPSVQIAPPAPSMMPNGSSSSPTQSLDDLNNKMNYLKAQQGLHRIQQQGENVPVTMASLHKMRANKEAIYKADVEAYKKVLDGTKVTGPMPKAIVNGLGTEQNSGSSNIQSAGVMALQIVTNKLQHDHTNMVAQLKQMDGDNKLREAQMEKDIQQRIDAAVQQQLEQKVQEALRVQLKAFFDANVKPTINQVVDDHSKDVATKFSQWTSSVDLKVQSLSRDVSELQTKHVVETDSNKSLSEQVSKLDVALNNDKDGLLTQVKNLDKRCDKLLGPDSLIITNITTRLSTEKQSLDKLIKESAAETSLSRITQSQFETRITKRLDAFEPSIDEKFSQKLASLDARISAVDKAQDKMVRKDILAELSTLKESLSEIKSNHNSTVPKNLVQELSSLKARTSSLETAHDESVRDDLKTLEKRLAAVEDSQNKITRAEHDRDISKPKTRMPPPATLKSLDELTEKVSNLATRISTVENDIPLQVSAQIQPVKDSVEGINSGLEEAELDIHVNKTDISSLNIELPQMITNKLLALETRMIEHLQKTNDTITSHEKDIGKLLTTLSSQGGEIEKLQSIQTSHGGDISKLHTITTKLQVTQPHIQAQQSRQDLSSRNNSRVNSPSLTGFESQIKTLSAEVQKVRQEVSAKISALDADGIQKLQRQFDIIRQACQSLENRFENLSTADLHSMMVHQLQQMYPSAPAFLDQLKANQIQIQDLVQRVRKVDQHLDPDSGDLHHASENIKKLAGKLHMIESNVAALQGDVQANPFKGSFNNETAYRGIQSALEKEVNDRKEVVVALRSDLTEAENEIYTTRLDLDQRIDEGQKMMQKIADDVARVVKETGDNQKRIYQIKDDIGPVRSRVARAEEDINKHAKRIDDVERDTSILDKGVLGGKNSKLSERVSEIERSSLDMNKRLPSLDELIGWKDRIIDTAGATPIIVAKQLILAEFLETLNEKLGVPVQHMNLEQLKANPFERNSIR